MSHQPELVFDEESHIYTVGGVRVPSVTTVIKGLDTDVSYANVPPFVLKRASDIGRDVHRCVEGWATKGEQVWSDDDSANAYLRGFYEFTRLGALGVDKSEIMCYHPEYWFAGTVDIVGTLWGEPCVIDVKTTNKIDRKYVELQLAAYKILIEFLYPELIGISRVVLHLDKKGRYTLHRFLSPFAEEDFLRAVEVYNDNRGKDSEG